MIRNAILTDTSAIWAFFDAGDQHHRAAAACFDELFAKPVKLLITDFIFNEVVTGLRMRAGWRPAVTAGECLQSGGRFIRIPTEAGMWDIAWTIFHDYEQLKLSFTDCFSAAVMRKYAVERIFTFDSDFAVLGFDLIPRK